MITTYLVLLTIAAFFSILLTFRYIKPSKAFMKRWLIGVGVGLLILFYIQIPLMEWSIVWTVLSFIMIILQLFLSAIYWLATFAKDNTHERIAL